MKIRFTAYLDCEDWNFDRIIRNAGLAHEVDFAEVTDKVWHGGTRELAVVVELDTETGVITVVGQEAS